MTQGLLINPQFLTCLSIINTKQGIKLYTTLFVIAPGITFCMYLGLGVVAENRVSSGVKVAVVTDCTPRLCVLIIAKLPSSANYPVLSVFLEHWETDRGARGRM